MRSRLKLMLALAALAASLALAGSRNYWAAAGELQQSSDANGNVSYYVEWRGLAHSSSHSEARGLYIDDTFSSSELTGSAILRYSWQSGILIFQDSRFLSRVTDYRWDTVHKYLPDRGGCDGEEFLQLLDDGLENAQVILRPGKGWLTATTRRLYLSFEHRSDASYHHHMDYSDCDPPRVVDRTEPQSVWFFPYQPNDVRGAGSGTRVGVDSPFDFVADKDDISSFSVAAQFHDDTTQQDIQWAAHAYELGKCASQKGPIQDGDPVIDHEDVNIDPGATEIEPNGKGAGGQKEIAGTALTIRVTCDQVPIKDVEIEITVDPLQKTGGHNHQANRPGGKLNALDIKKANPDSNTFVCPCKTLKTDANGYVTEPSFSNTPAGTVKFTPPRAGESAAKYGSYDSGVGGEYVIKARPTNPKFKSSEANTHIQVHPIPKLEVLERTGDYFVCCPKEVEPHKANNYGASHTLQQFRALAKAFYDYQTTHNLGLQPCQIEPWDHYHVSFNDIALEDGGVFDRFSNWRPGHQTHNKGEGGDVNRFNDVSDSTTEDDCVGSPPHKKKIKLRQWLMHTLLELGTGYGHWDCSDLHAGSPQHLTSAQCSNQENQDFHFPPNAGLGHVTNQQGQQVQDTLHLHVDD